MSRMDSRTRERSLSWFLTILAGGMLCAVLPVNPQAELYSRRVILLWDCSQSIVKRIDRETTPPKTVWMARNADLERLERYVFDLLFRDTLPPVTAGDLFSQDTKTSSPSLPLADENTLLTAYLINRERTQNFSMQREILLPSPDREERLRHFLPRPERTDKQYQGLETHLVRPMVEAVFDPEITGLLVPHTDEIYLIMVSDEVEESMEPYTNQAVVKKHLELKNRRQYLFTYVVNCQPSQAAKNHQVIITVYQIFDKPIAATPTPAITATVPTPVPTPEPAGEPGPPAEAVIHAAIPPEGLVIKKKGGRLVSSPFLVEVEDDPSRAAPLPALEANLLDEKHHVISTGRLEFPNATVLPAEGRLVFQPIAGKEWPALGKITAPSPAEDNLWVLGVKPDQFPARFQSYEFLNLILVLLGLVLAGAGGLAYAQWRLAPPRKIRVQFTLNPNSATARNLKPLILPADLPVILDESEGPDAPGFPFPCEPLTLVYERGWFSGKVRIFSEEGLFRDSTSPEEEWEEESGGGSTREWTIPIRRDEGGSRMIVLRETDAGPRTWDVRVEARPETAAAVPADSGNSLES